MEEEGISGVCSGGGGDLPEEDEPPPAEGGEHTGCGLAGLDDAPPQYHFLWAFIQARKKKKALGRPSQVHAHVTKRRQPASASCAAAHGPDQAAASTRQGATLIGRRGGSCLGWPWRCGLLHGMAYSRHCLCPVAVAPSSVPGPFLLLPVLSRAERLAPPSHRLLESTSLHCSVSRR